MCSKYGKCIVAFDGYTDSPVASLYKPYMSPEIVGTIRFFDDFVGVATLGRIREPHKSKMAATKTRSNLKTAITLDIITLER